jgi:single-strand DNA-binding protein
MSNSINFLGNIVRDPELKQVGENSVLEFNCANNVGFGDRQVTNWFRCTMWGKRAQSLSDHLKKGQQIFVIGQLSLKKFTNKDGVEQISPDVRVSEIEFVRGGNSEAAPETSQRATPTDNDDQDSMPF